MAEQTKIDFPFEEVFLSDGFYLRKFTQQTDSEEFIWHRDAEDRNITVLESNGWLLQIDESVPVVMKPEDFYFIPKNTWHRVIKGKDNLVVIVEKLLR